MNKPYVCTFCLSLKNVDSQNASKNVYKLLIPQRSIFVQKGVQLVTKVCYYLELSYIYKHLIINKKALCLIAEGCTSGVR